VLQVIGIPETAPAIKTHPLRRYIRHMDDLNLESAARPSRGFAHSSLRDGFWELTQERLSRYSHGFIKNWAGDRDRRTTLGELESVLKARAWMELMARIRRT